MSTSSSRADIGYGSYLGVHDPSHADGQEPSREVNGNESMLITRHNTTRLVVNNRSRITLTKIEAVCWKGTIKTMNPEKIRNSSVSGS